MGKPQGGLLISICPKGLFWESYIRILALFAVNILTLKDPHYADPFINTEEALSHMSYRAAMKESLCTFKRSPVP